MPAETPQSIELNACRRPQWDRLLTAAGRSSLEQSWSYDEAMTACYGQTVDRVGIGDGNALPAMAQVFRKPVFGLTSIVRGPIWRAKDADKTTRIGVYRAIRDGFSLCRPELLFWIPELTDTPESHALMGATGMRRMVTGLLLWRGMLELKKTGTAWLDLGGMNTASAAGVARFKLGLNPEVFTLAGTYF